MTSQRPAIEIVRLPQPMGYAEMLVQQRERREAIQAGEAPNTLFLLEHTPVITLGRNSHRENLLLSEAELAARGIEVVETDRGGDVTYHGPGQLVAYPLLDLHQWRLSVNWYLRTLEQVLIDVLATYGLSAERSMGQTGVWVRGAKVAAIGIGVHKWVTFHGIALNVAPEMAHFSHIIPCGIQDKPVTSLQALLEAPPTLDETAEVFSQHFLRQFC